MFRQLSRLVYCRDVAKSTGAIELSKEVNSGIFEFFRAIVVPQNECKGPITNAQGADDKQ